MSSFWHASTALYQDCLQGFFACNCALPPRRRRCVAAPAFCSHAAVAVAAPALCSHAAVAADATWIKDIMLQRGNVKMLVEHSSEYHQQF
ncbi:hypothetical protein E2562_023471 [Oryza meyeriana var. granulata]|uniref:Uncharacterized protein n=1 Tax=Oryza meyeriana var. granulata TaxID=110450 RepID=A0A6G1BY13_9ORYZ|nr:hypothetical protein E2562_023471 [Oryza meyeriana var. granulata]